MRADRFDGPLQGAWCRVPVNDEVVPCRPPDPDQPALGVEIQLLAVAALPAPAIGARVQLSVLRRRVQPRPDPAKCHGVAIGLFNDHFRPA